MFKATMAVRLTRAKKRSPRFNFEGDYARYRRLLGILDGVASLDEKRNMFRKLFGLLTRMEAGIWSHAEQTADAHGPERDHRLDRPKRGSWETTTTRTY
jgi:hypothetical protein